MEKFFKKILFTKKQIEEKCKELGKWVDDTYKDTNDLILVGILKGSIPFVAELIKNVKSEMVLDFMIVSSFKGKMKSDGNLKILLDLNFEIYNKNILIVEEIIDRGLTINKLLETLKTRKPKSIKVLSLLNKSENRKIEVQIDKYGFDVPNEFLVGFGLDVKEKLRNAPFIGIFNEKKYNDV